MDFRINHNRHGVLDFTFEIEGCGAYPSSYLEHHAFDLATGKELKAKDLFRAESMGALVKKLDARLQQEITAVRRGQMRDIPTECGEAQPDGHFSKAHLEEYTIGLSGVTFHFPYGFPHVALACEPPGKFVMSFAELKEYMSSDSPLVRMLADGSSR
jgi:hypothetical protein